MQLWWGNYNTYGVLDNEKEKQGETISTKEGNCYNTSVRKCTMHYALQHQCPTDHVSDIIKFTVEEFTGKKLQRLPHSSTVTRMAREMGTVSDVQAGSVLSETPNCTLAFDATDVDGAHLNEVHVTANSGPGEHKHLTLCVSNLPGGTAQDYTTQIR